MLTLLPPVSSVTCSTISSIALMSGQLQKAGTQGSQTWIPTGMQMTEDSRCDEIHAFTGMDGCKAMTCTVCCILLPYAVVERCLPEVLTRLGSVGAATARKCSREGEATSQCSDTGGLEDDR